MSNVSDKILSKVINDNSLFPKVSKYKLLFEQEDFIIFFYLEQFHSQGLVLTRDILESTMKVNVFKWLSKNSIIKKKDQTALSREYLESRTTQQILDKETERDVLQDIVLDRFDELSEYDVSDTEFNSLLNVLDIENSLNISDMIVKDIQKLYSGTVYIDKKAYNKENILDYLELKIENYREKSNTSLEVDDYENYLIDDYMSEVVNSEKCFDWNIGTDNLPSIRKSYMVSVLGLSKVGKTRFVTGEMIYPTLLNGKNVLILSGEMSASSMFSFILIKDIYLSEGVRMSSTTCSEIIGVESVLKSNGITLEEAVKAIKNNSVNPNLVKMNEVIMGVNEVPKSIRELVIMRKHDIIKSNKMGTPFLRTKKDGIFEYSNLKGSINDLVDKLNVEMVVIDHMGLIESDSPAFSSSSELMKKSYQLAKQIADRDKTVITINHIDTQSEEKIASGNSNGIVTARAFNSNEAKKSADVEFVLYTTEASKREGTLFMDFKYSRWEKAPSSPIQLISDYLVNDFVIPGVEKQPYKMITIG